MTEIERIRQMAADGTITREEADELIAVLEDIDRTERAVGAVGSAADRASSNAEPEAAEPPDLSRARVEAAQPTRTEPEASLATPADARWLTIDTLAGDIDVRVDPSLDAPVAEGPDGLRLEAVDDDFVLRVEREGFLDGFLKGKVDIDIDVRIPEGFGVDLRMKAGDVDLRGVPFLRGQLLAGDVSAKGLRAVDLSMSAGDLELELAATEGENRVSMKAGDLHVRLDPGSDVAVEGRVSIGDVSVPDGFQVTSKGLGKTFRGTLGRGAAKLQIHQSAGDTKVSVRS